uniref:BMA-NEX-4 n=1 Tax=Brugia malayi TaxID=6279 RepID=A0A0I9R331_BRUMA|nr:BMA-NEX-4 [Brugia malayi]
MHSSSSTSLSSLTDNSSTDDSVNVAKFPVSKSIPNIPDDDYGVEVDGEIIENEAEEGECNDNDKMDDQSVNQKKLLSMPLIYQMNLNKNKNIRGTVIGPSDENFHPVKVSEKLREALNGLDTNEKVIIEVTVGHNNFQRQQIMNAYECLYSKNNKLSRAIAVEIACTRTTTVEGMFGVMLQLLLCEPRNEQINEANVLIEEHVNLIVKDSNGIEKISHNVALFEKLFIGHPWSHIAMVIDTIDAKLGGNGHFVETQIIYNGNIPNDIKNMLLTIGRDKILKD